jgi:hypothetical protein
MKILIQNTKVETGGGLMTGVCLGIATIVGGILDILNMRHISGIAVEGREVVALFAGARHRGGDHKVLAMRGGGQETVLEVQTKDLTTQQTINGPGPAIPETEQARVL